MRWASSRAGMSASASRRARGRAVVRGLARAAAAIAIACCGAAAANERRVGPASGTSACIGDAASAICAVDTLMACLARAERALCQRVGAEPPEPMPPPRTIAYVVDRSSVIRREQVGDDQRDLAWFRPGYTLVELRMRFCPATASCADEPWEDVQVYLRRQGQAWQIVNWMAPGDPDASPQIPDSFVPRPP